jgi:hypothetical protein
MLLNKDAQCLCSAGYTGNSNTGCTDIDECKGNPCGPGAVCNNEPGSFSCQCPGGISGDPFREGCSQAKSPTQCSAKSPCPGSEICVQDEFVGESVCICQRGYIRDPKTGKCRDANECTELREIFLEVMSVSVLQASTETLFLAVKVIIEIVCHKNIFLYDVHFYLFRMQFIRMSM